MLLPFPTTGEGHETEADDRARLQPSMGVACLSCLSPSNRGENSFQPVQPLLADDRALLQGAKHGGRLSCLSPRGGQRQTVYDEAARGGG